MPRCCEASGSVGPLGPWRSARPRFFPREREGRRRSSERRRNRRRRGPARGRPNNTGDSACLHASGCLKFKSHERFEAAPHALFPSPLVGEGARAEAIAERGRVRGRGVHESHIPSPLPAAATLSHRGERVARGVSEAAQICRRASTQLDRSQRISGTGLECFSSHEPTQRRSATRLACKRARRSHAGRLSHPRSLRLVVSLPCELQALAA